MRIAIASLFAGALLSSAVGQAADPPPQPFWSGRLADKTKSASFTQQAAGADAKPGADSNQANQQPPAAREPEWLQRMDHNERSTLTGGWGLQNWSGGSQSQTSAGDRDGYYAPNTYQGSQFQQWNNVFNRQDVPSWNGSAANFPQEMWSQGYASPMNYAGPGAQLWGNMSSGTMMPGMSSGGWTMFGW